MLMIAPFSKIKLKFKVWKVCDLVKTFKVRLPKEVLESLDKLIEKGVISGYAEAVRRGLELFLELKSELP